MHFIKKEKGIFIALGIVTAWFGSLAYLLPTPHNWHSPVPYLLILVQTHLYTGLFITAHDAMHGVVSRNRKVNQALGICTACLFGYTSFFRLLPQHHSNDRHFGTSRDPIHHDSNFFASFYSFMK